MSGLYSSKQIVKALEREGFIWFSQRGSHMKFRKLGRPVLTVIVPANKKEVPFGTLSSILRQAHLTESSLRRR